MDDLLKWAALSTLYHFNVLPTTEIAAHPLSILKLHIELEVSMTDALFQQLIGPVMQVAFPSNTLMD